MPEDIIGRILGKEKPKFRNRPSNEWVLDDTTIGVEIEVEGVPFRALGGLVPEELKHYWAWHDEDNSLHNNGCEFTFRNPLFGEDAQIALTVMLKIARENRFQTSLRTGIHVHMDARDMSRHQLLGLCAYYTMFEPAIYAWVGDERHANNFCLPWYKFEGALSQASEILKSCKQHSVGVAGSDLVIMSCEQFHRYAGLNLKSLGTFGSIEFRQLKTTLEYDRVRDWINLLMGLKQAALRAPDSSIAIIRDIQRTGFEQSAANIFGRRTQQEMWQANPNLNQEIEDGPFYNAAELILDVTSDGHGMYQWNVKPEEPMKPHEGFQKWRAKHYPKDVIPKKEKPKTKAEFLRDFEAVAAREARGIRRVPQPVPPPMEEANAEELDDLDEIVDDAIAEEREPDPAPPLAQGLWPPANQAQVVQGAGFVPQGANLVVNDWANADNWQVPAAAAELLAPEEGRAARIQRMMDDRELQGLYQAQPRIQGYRDWIIESFGL